MNGFNERTKLADYAMRQGKWVKTNIKLKLSQSTERTVRSISRMDKDLEVSQKSDLPPAIPAPPCDGCTNYNDCRELLLSCAAFNTYANDPNNPETTIGREALWQPLPRIPSKKYYNRLFHPKNPGGDSTPNLQPLCD